MNASTFSGCVNKPIPRRQSPTERADFREWVRIVVKKETKMSEKKKDELLHDHNHDGVDRRGFLKCMAWAGTGAFCVIQGGVLKSYSLSRLSDLGLAAATAGDLSFVQISDSH